jgi:hypothetical protein
VSYLKAGTTTNRARDARKKFPKPPEKSVGFVKAWYNTPFH